MQITAKYPYAIAALFLWVGFVGAISFMEAWLKFRAPGITLPLGLGIGRIVFGALNKVEWVLAVVVVCNFLFTGGRPGTGKIALYAIPVVLLALQTFRILPLLDARAELYIAGAEVPPSNLHFYYVGMETVKVVCLFALGWILLKIPS